ncbi:hypothetical protein [Streptomyces sp. NPDC004291]
MARVRMAVVATALIATVAPVALGGTAAHAVPATATAVGAAAEVGKVVQEGGRLAVPAGDEGAVTLRFTATLPAGTKGPVTGVLRLPDMLTESAGSSPVSENVLRSTCAVNGVAYGACRWDMPYQYDDREVEKPSLALPAVPAAATLVYAVTLDADRSATVLGRPDALVELKDAGGAVVAVGTVGLDFVDGTPPALERGALHARDRNGVLWRYEGTGDVRRPFGARERIGGGWNAYTAVTPLWNARAAGYGDLVARDRSGVLWYYRGTGDPDAPFAPRTRVGGGWNVYTALSGTGDGNLVARDKSGALWVYEKTIGGSGAPFKPRRYDGRGWNAYDVLVPAGGNDGALARDKSGVLWKYENADWTQGPPFAPRHRVGGGWNVYTALAGTAELGRDGTGDLVARDAAGKLWLYQGVTTKGNDPTRTDSVVPGPTRSLIGGGWNAYDMIF